MTESLLRRILRELAALAQLAWPMVVVNLSYIGMRFTDTVFAGQLSPEDLGAVSVGGDLWMPVTLFNMGVLMAVSPLAAHAFGAGDRLLVASIVRQAAWVALAGSLLGILVLAQAGTVMTAIGVAPELIPKAAGYARGISWGLPAIMLFYVLRFASEAVSYTRPLLLVAVAGLLFNAFADWVLMYGKLGFPRLGAVGTGYATALSQWVMFLVLLSQVRRAPLFRPFRLFEKFEWPRWSMIREQLGLGVPIAVSVFMEGGLFSAVGLLMATLGTTAVAGHQIAVNWGALMFMVPLGLAAGITVRVGQALGRGKPDEARFAGASGLVLCVGFMAVSALCMLAFRKHIVGLYTDDPAVTAMAMSLLFVAAAFQLFDGLQVGAAGVLRGYKDTRVPMIMTLIAYWGIGFQVAWLTGIRQQGGPVWVWIGLVAGLCAAGLMLVGRFWWRHVRR